MNRLENVNTEKHGGDFSLKNVERAGANVLAVEGLAIGYPGITLASNIDFLLHRGECLGIIGGNGTGKTTLLKTILGNIRELDGKITWGTKIKMGYYSQQLEDLDRQSDLIGEMRKVNSLAESGDLRSFLAGFLFFGEDVFKKVGDLSGGEKGRLAIAKLIYSKANVLILDEPTNHLDIPSREALEQALGEYDGTIITVSHDRYFLDRVVTQIIAFEETGNLEIYNGNYSQYYEWREARENEIQKPERTPEQVETSKDEAVVKLKQTDNPLSKNEIRKVEKRITEIEKHIPDLEENLKSLGHKMTLPGIIANHDEFLKFAKRYELKEIELKSLYLEWESLLEKINWLESTQKALNHRQKGR